MRIPEIDYKGLVFMSGRFYVRSVCAKEFTNRYTGKTSRMYQVLMNVSPTDDACEHEYLELDIYNPRLIEKLEFMVETTYSKVHVCARKMHMKFTMPDGNVIFRDRYRVINFEYYHRRKNLWM